MARRIGIKFGEAMTAGSEDWLWTEPEIAIGELNGPVGQSMANLMGQSAGFSRFFCLVDGGKQVKPVTLMVPKVHLKKMIDVQIFGGPRWKDDLLHRVQRVEDKGRLELPPVIEGFRTRRVNFTFRYVPDDHVTAYAALPAIARDDVRGYVATLAAHSAFFATALASERNSS